MPSLTGFLFVSEVTKVKRANAKKANEKQAKKQERVRKQALRRQKQRKHKQRNNSTHVQGPSAENINTDDQEQI